MYQRNIFLIILFFIVGHGYSQQSSKDPNSSFIENTATSDIRSKLSSPFGASSLSNLVSNVSVSSFFEQGVNGKIELQGKFDSRWSGGLTIDQKIGKTDKQALPLDLSGISPGTTVKFNLQRMFWHPSFTLSDVQIADLNAVTHAYEITNKIPANTAGLREISLKGTDEEKRMALAAFNKVSFREPCFINLELGFTKTSFSYTTDSVTLKENQDVFITPTFKVSVIKALGEGFDVLGYAALSYNYAESYTPADDVNFSLPFGTTRNFYTTTLAFGKPSKTTSHNIIAELRRNIFTKTNSNIAISPTVTLGINTKKLSVFLPVYFIRGADEKGKLIDGLQGGIRFGYITSLKSGEVSNFKNGFIAQLIISQPLDFLNKL